jgi:hypothetical protein
MRVVRCYIGNQLDIQLNLKVIGDFIILFIIEPILHVIMGK